MKIKIESAWKTLCDASVSYTHLTQKPSPNQRERHIIHDYIRIEGDMKVLEEAPQDALIEMIDNKKVIGRLFKVRFISFDPQSLHTVELVDFPGIKIKMKDSGSLNRVPFKQGDEISVCLLYTSRCV